MEVLERYYASPKTGVYNCPSFPDGFPMNYFLSSRWLAVQDRHNLLMTDIRKSSLFILSADCTHPHLYPPWFGNTDHTTDDCDKDDATDPGLAFAGEDKGFDLHRAGNNVLFGDGHVLPYKKFDPQAMTYNPHVEGQNWGQVTAE
jgi:prepilin-type processing-associated H-X9-DG protein